MLEIARNEATAKKPSLNRTSPSTQGALIPQPPRGRNASSAAAARREDISMPNGVKDGGNSTKAWPSPQPRSRTFAPPARFTNVAERAMPREEMEAEARALAGLIGDRPDFGPTRFLEFCRAFPRHGLELHRIVPRPVDVHET